MNDSKIVLVADDSRVARLMTRRFFLTRPGWQVGEAARGDAAFDKVQATSPMQIMIDINLPAMGRIAACAHRARMCTSRWSPPTYKKNALRNGASEMGIGFMKRPISEARIHALLGALE